MHWNVSPQILQLGPLELRWYGLLFALAFYAGFQILRRFFRFEGRPLVDVDPLLMYMVIGTIGGARLGHCLFYEPGYFLVRPWEIPMVWKGGLASHGAFFGIIASLFVYRHRYVAKWSKAQMKKMNEPWLWLMDRIAVTIAFGGILVRLGNLMNSEILGKQTDVPWAFVFERIDTIPRHPAQLYESLVCVVTFIVMWTVYHQKKIETPRGKLLGIFLVFVFSSRFLIEFLKERQVAFEADLLASIGLNMGQLLSVPLVILGAWLWNRSRRISLDVPKKVR